jgi:hypothetical protein
MIFKRIVDDALEQCGHSIFSENSEPRVRIEGFVNQWLRRLLTDPRFDRLRKGSISFASVANIQRVGLPPVIQRVNRIYETTNNNRLFEQSLDWLRQRPQQGVATTGVPQYYIPIGLSPVTRVPAATGTGLWAASSSAADTTQKVSVSGVRVNGYKFEPLLTTLNGLTRVAIGAGAARTDYIDVLTWGIDNTAAGDISLYDAAAAGNVLSVIPIGNLAVRYFTVELWPVPASAITYYVECDLRIQELVRPTDEPMFTEDYHDLLTKGAIYLETLMVKKQVETARAYMASEIGPREIQLLDYLVNNPDLIIVPMSGRERLVSNNLGGAFPSGYW